ncbi:MAG: MurT ligase domain-containing protein [Bacilli bacterium]
MNFIILLITKPIQFLLKKLNRGTSLPGSIAYSLNKNIFAYFKLPKITICITGTTGKTSIASTLAATYEQAGLKVGYNPKGSNLLYGILSSLIDSSKLNGKSKVDALIMEVDERYVKNIFKFFHPKYFVISNLSRDQLARNGHADDVFEEINNSITDDMHLVLNVDDPLVNKFSLKHKGKITFYGLAKTSTSTKGNMNALDVAYCPICHHKLNFNYFNYGNLGDYACPNGDFKRTKPNYEAKMIDDFHFKLDNNIIKMDNDAIYRVYNLTACYVVGKLTNINSDTIISSFNSLSLKVKRLSTFKLDNINGVLLLSKNESPISYNQSLLYIKKYSEPKTIVIGFNNISGRYNLKDLSWLYDINFELLNDDSVKKIICVGKFACDLIVRLKCAGINTNKIITCFNSNDMLNVIKAKSIGKVYCMLYFDTEKMLKKMLIKEGADL